MAINFYDEDFSEDFSINKGEFLILLGHEFELQRKN
jgi:hypothetical protein